VQTGGGVANLNFVYLDPSELGYPIEGINHSFMRYRFTRLNIMYYPLCDYRMAGNVVGFYTPDAKTAHDNISTVGALMTLEDSFEVAPTFPSMLRCESLNKGIFYNYADITTGTDARMSRAGAIGVQGNVVYQGATPTVEMTIGSLWVSYTVELFGLGDNPTLHSPSYPPTRQPPPTPKLPYRQDEEKEGYVDLAARSRRLL